jgi:hypothetical protein
MESALLIPICLLCFHPVFATMFTMGGINCSTASESTMAVVQSSFCSYS